MFYNQNQQAFGSLDFGTVNYGDEQYVDPITKIIAKPHSHQGAYTKSTNLLIPDEHFHPPLQPESAATTPTPTPAGTSSYSRPSGKKLPFVKGGATDAGVEKVTGIKGLVSEIQKKMGIAVTGSITSAQITAYQTAQGLGVDGTIGRETYSKLGFPAPYPSSSRSSSSSYSSSTDITVGSEPFYKKKWFLYSAIGLTLVGTGFLLFYPKGDE